MLSVSHHLDRRPERLRLATLIVVAVLCSSSVLCSRTVIAEEPQASKTQVPTAPTTIPVEQIDQWIAQLDDDRFDTRQRAQQQLEIAGRQALDAVAKVAQNGSLESSTRAINILLNWSKVPSEDLQLAALQKLVEMPNRPRESVMAAKLLANARERIAIAEITKLGGKVTQIKGYNNVRVSYLHVVIDKDWKGGNDGIKHVAKVRNAVRISLRVAPLTDVALEPLVSLPQLQVLEIHGTKLSDEAIQKFQQHRPTTIVDPQMGAMLGIQGVPNDPNKNGVAIDNVVVNGAAHKAGLQSGDRITKLNGKPLTDFKSLTTLIKNYNPGDTVELDVLRKNKPVTKQVTFDIWGAADNEKLVGQPQPPNVSKRLPVQRVPISVQPR